MFLPSIRFAPVLLMSLVLAACSKPTPTEEPVRAVKVMTVGEGNFESRLEFSADVRARVESRLGFRVGGKVIRRVVEPGQVVKVGQVLAQLDPQDYKLAADAARAQVAAAQTNRDLAAADYKRYKDLRDQNFISGAELERRDAALKAAQAQLDQAQAQLTTQGNMAGYTTLVADVAGVVTAVSAEVGQVVSAGAPVVQIAQDGPRDAVFAVPEDKVGLITQGTKVDVTVWASKSQLSGSVREVAASADPVTRTFTIKVALDARETLPLGTTVTVSPKALDRGNASVIKLPTSALLKSGEGSSVWVLDPTTMTLKSQAVVVATADGNDAVISDGLAAGMQVVVAGVHVLSSGQKVTIYGGKETQASVQSGALVKASAETAGTTGSAGK
jgi:multidrug efflux system membrane fusion protein